MLFNIKLVCIFTLKMERPAKIQKLMMPNRKRTFDDMKDVAVPMVTQPQQRPQHWRNYLEKYLEQSQPPLSLHCSCTTVKQYQADHCGP